jgi:hypothetical protein
LESFNSYSLQAEGKITNELIKQIEIIGFNDMQMPYSLWKEVPKSSQELL